MCLYVCVSTHTYRHPMEYYSAIKKEFVKTQMDLKGIMLNEISQTEKEKYYTISLTCGIQKTKTELTDTKGRQVTAKVGEG